MITTNKLTLNQVKKLPVNSLIWIYPLRDYAKTVYWGILYFGTDRGTSWKELEKQMENVTIYEVT